MKYLLLFLALPASLFGFQKTTPTKANPPKGNVTINCRLYNMSYRPDSLKLYEFYGLGSKVIAAGALRASDSMYVITVPNSTPRFLNIGYTDVTTAKIIVGEEPEIKFFANMQVMEKGRTAASPANIGYEQLLKKIDALKNQSNLARASFMTQKGPEYQKAVLTLNNLNVTKQKLLDSLKTANPLLHRVATLMMHPDYNGQAQFPTEVDFLSNQFLAYANLQSDRKYDQIPDVTTAFENFFSTLQQAGASGDQIQKFLNDALTKIPVGTKTHRMALSGMINAAKLVSAKPYPIWTRQYIDLYKKQDMGEIGRLEAELKKTSTFTPGFEAPDIVGMTPDSTNLALSTLRGKIVLVDFWASWCGPCRKENPNVKANYEKYKNKGFEVFGVSLDRDYGAWVNAIKQDGLPWKHVSDLKGWQSVHAALYSVNSIPQTILLDREGKIIVRNIRGEQLGSQLKEIFGE